MILEKDAVSAGYLRRLYNVHWDDSSLYHVIVNTDKLSVDQAAHRLAQLVKEFSPQPEGVA